MEDGKIYGPYKATKLWNEMVRTFRNGIPLKRHRRHIKVYENCFTGQEAVSWFQRVLKNNPCVGNSVTREQTIQLLNKFLKAGVFQNVNASSEMQQYIKEGDLYQLTEIRSPRLPLGMRPQNIPLKAGPQQRTSKPAFSESYNTVGLPTVLQEYNLNEHSSPCASGGVVENKMYPNQPSSCGTRYGEQYKKHNLREIPPNSSHKENEPTSGTYQSHSSEVRIGSYTAAHYNIGFTASPREQKQESAGSRRLADPCAWLDPLTLDSADAQEHKYSGDYSNLPKLHIIQRSQSVLHSRLSKDSADRISDSNGYEKVIHNGKGSAVPFHYRAASTSQLKSSPNVHFSPVAQDRRENFKRCGSVGFPKSDIKKENPAPVNQNLQIGDMWKQALISRLETLVPGLAIFFKLELENVPGEWISTNGTATIHHQHDSHFPQSLVAAMNCLVHWPQAVPNEILTAFKEHYFKLKEPLTTFKLYSLFCKVYLHITSSGIVPSGRGLLPLKLPPNSCFETAFTSDSPVTRIVPQRSVDTLHFSRHGRFSKSSLPKRISSAPNLSEQFASLQPNQKMSNWSGSKHQKCGKQPVKMNRRISRRMRAGMEEDKMYHVRNKSGGYVNPALSQSIDDIEDPTSLPEQELDYAAALETLNALMRCSHRETSLNAVGGWESDSRSSESSSYYTAASSSSSAASSRRSSFDLMEPVHMTIEESKEKLLVSVMQLLLICIPVYYRTQLRYLLHFMNQWTIHHSLCGQADVISIFTPTILRSNLEGDYDMGLARSIVHFFVAHHEAVLNVPPDLENDVSAIQTQKIRGENRVTYCKQVSSQQFEQQKLTGSQRALSELLEQILQDAKMPLKEKRKRLKMFKESYPHIYHHRFPDSTLQDKVLKKQPGGLLNLATLSRLKSLRV